MVSAFEKFGVVIRDDDEEDGGPVVAQSAQEEAGEDLDVVDEHEADDLLDLLQDNSLLPKHHR